MRGVVDLRGELFEIIIQRVNVGRVLFPRTVVHESLLIDIFLKQSIELVVINSRGHVDIFSLLRMRSHRDEDQLKDSNRYPKFVRHPR
jgi:hypothetical protein